MRPEQSESLVWRQHGERTLFESPWVRVTKVDVTPPDGHRFEHHAVRLQRVAVAVVLDDQDHVLLVWRHRFITKSWGWELPGGIVDSGETGAEASPSGHRHVAVNEDSGPRVNLPGDDSDASTPQAEKQPSQGSSPSSVQTTDKQNSASGGSHRSRQDNPDHRSRN